ncbi:NADH dehydrogenase [ubiquinone] 1 alpha subcomplex subunit 8-like [Ornithodoros turicata]|uniref:NADH dehydrogenase [ubiquinone] 1 alpha subcomplex subunit 8 n=1 Tax=Ornithodoros turicata TaxID=34597 RepID=A0A2R5LH94_9ACAR
MSFTEDYVFPSDSELTVEELNISTPALRAGAYHFGKYCDEQSKEFMLCKKEENDPRRCLADGRAVTACALEFFRKVKKSCRQQFDDYAHCLEFSSSRMEYNKCRKTQAALDNCMLENLNIERPHLGYFAMPRIHHTERPKPKTELRDSYEQTPGLPDDFPREPARHGTRAYWYM